MHSAFTPYHDQWIAFSRFPVQRRTSISLSTQSRNFWKHLPICNKTNSISCTRHAFVVFCRYCNCCWAVRPEYSPYFVNRGVVGQTKESRNDLNTDVHKGKNDEMSEIMLLKFWHLSTLFRGGGGSSSSNRPGRG